MFVCLSFLFLCLFCALDPVTTCRLNCRLLIGIKGPLIYACKYECINEIGREQHSLQTTNLFRKENFVQAIVLHNGAAGFIIPVPLEKEYKAVDRPVTNGENKQKKARVSLNTVNYLWGGRHAKSSEDTHLSLSKLSRSKLQSSST